jgi:D-lyxose ketol-isomerase
MTAADQRKARRKALQFLRRARIAITPTEAEAIEVADFGLHDLDHFGLEIVTYENNDRYCAKEMVLFPRQTCPEHRHPPTDGLEPGKQETFRCRWGEVYLYIDGAPTKRPKAKLPGGRKRYLTVWKEIVLKPGDQFTLPPNTLHWFQSGDRGAIISEFSSTSDDETDVFTDPGIQRMPVVEKS